VLRGRTPITPTPREGFIILVFYDNSPTSLCRCDRPLGGGQLAPHHEVQVWTTLYVVQQLRGAAGAWWASYIATLPDDHHVPWGEFHTAFCAHHLSASLLRSKLKEFLGLEQGNHSVFHYTRQFNTLVQYHTYHIDTDEKKANLYHARLTIHL
jgi:hypothetical protein